MNHANTPPGAGAAARTRTIAAGSSKVTGHTTSEDPDQLEATALSRRLFDGLADVDYMFQLRSVDLPSRHVDSPGIAVDGHQRPLTAVVSGTNQAS